MTLAVNSGLKSTSHSFTSLAYAKCKLFINIYVIEIKSTVSRYITVLFESLKLFIPWLEAYMRLAKNPWVRVAFKENFIGGEGIL
jgi:hypothetical protein